MMRMMLKLILCWMILDQLTVYQGKRPSKVTDSSSNLQMQAEAALRAKDAALRERHKLEAKQEEKRKSTERVNWKLKLKPQMWILLCWRPIVMP